MRITTDYVDGLESFIESVRLENNELEIQINDESNIYIDKNIFNRLTLSWLKNDNNKNKGFGN